MTYVLVAALCALVGLGTAAYYAMWVLKQDPGSAKMQRISKHIQEGALAFLTREYRTVAVVLVAIAIAMSVFLRASGGVIMGIAYLVGAVFSGTAGFIGLTIATRANSRTTQAATKGMPMALEVAFRGGAVMGLTVAGLGLLGVSLCFIVFLYATGLVKDLSIVDGATWDVFGMAIPAMTIFSDVIPGFGLGASTIALFARVGGGIYTKAADVGADLVGKVEAGIPEDDPRNPAVIADNVGDNVGDVAGMGADLYESYVGAIVAPLALGALYLGFRGALLPVLIAAVGMVCSAIATAFVRGKAGGHPARALSTGTYGAAVLTLAACYFLVMWLVPAGTTFGVHVVSNPLGFFVAIFIGLAAGMAIGQASEIYTSDTYKAVKQIAESGTTGPATVILSGLATGMQSTGVSIIFLVIAMGVSYWAGNWAMPDGGGIFAVGLSAIGMLATTGIVVAVDAYGPIADNAGGISEMSGQGPEVRAITDSLDSVGNTTAAIAKGFAIASAAVTALAYFQLYAEKVGLLKDGINILNNNVIIGLFLGAMFPFLFSSMAINAVGRAAQAMIEEVRRQFHEIKGLREGVEGVEGEYGKCVNIATGAALKQMVLPASLASILPIAVGLWSRSALGGFLAGVLVVGFLMAIFMANAGGAWDNAKKYVEGGEFGGKGSDTHKAAVVGDTVGDPFKDTAGPSMNILIKVMSVIAVVFAPLFTRG
ncbi:MAG: sodium-translocating pyrophosphatase [Actinobacteria bacterium]|nr:MAG: sodium-translocating pyrophosphatase [Actinomycetota bacterium]